MHTVATWDCWVQGGATRGEVPLRASQCSNALAQMRDMRRGRRDTWRGPSWLQTGQDWPTTWISRAPLLQLRNHALYLRGPRRRPAQGVDLPRAPAAAAKPRPLSA